MPNGLNAAAFLMFNDVQAAFLFDRAGPAAGALVFAIRDWPGAGPAADARVALVVERIVGHVILVDETPHIFLGPGEERVDFDQVELGIPVDNIGTGAVARLIAANGADPGIVAHHRPPQG